MTNPVQFQPPGAFIAHLAKVGYRKTAPPSSEDDFEVQTLDLTPLRLDVSFFTPFLTSKRLSAHRTVNSEQLAEVFPDLDKTAKALQRKLVVLTVGGKLLSIEKSLIEDLGLCGIAVIDRPVIEGVLAAQDPTAKAKLLSAALVQFLGRESLSPYVSGRPAIAGRFFGRSTLVKRMIPSAGNFTILGNRRIGKTSLLKELKERLKMQNVRTGEIYGATCASTQDVVYNLLMSLDRFREAEKFLSEPQRPKNLASYIHKSLDVDKRPVAVFIDELDRILEFDAKQNWEVLDILRETFEGHPSCRVFLAGFRKVMEVKQNLSSPLFNFTTPVELPLFTREETLEMVTRPLERLGIAVANTDLSEAIYRETGGHPELIQIHCSGIVRFMQDHGRAPTGADLLTNVFNSEEYKQKVLGTFLANTNALEELLCYLLIADAESGGNATEHEFSHQDVNRVLKAVNITLDLRDIDGIIHNLKVSGIISPVIGVVEKYRFSAPQLVNYVIGLELDFCIEKAFERVRESADNARVWTEPSEEESKSLTL